MSDPTDTADVAGPGRIRELAESYRLCLDVRSPSGTYGRQAGRETGASVEVQDFRDYVPGDDPRRIDWMAYGRTDRLVVRLYREEVSPFFDVVVDTSASLSIADGRKHALAHELCRWLFHSGRSADIAVRLFAAGEDVRRLEGPEELRFEAESSALLERPRRVVEGLRTSSVRLLLSDFMSPIDPAAVIRPYAEGSSLLLAVRLLGPWEADPDPSGPVELVDREAGRSRQMNVEASAVEDYRRRLRRLTDALEDEISKSGGRWMSPPTGRWRMC
ncbi:MAG: DUF58 domain-containing protein [Planctomycetota bacterium]